MLKRFLIIGATLAVAFFYAQWEKTNFEGKLGLGETQYVLKTVPDASFYDLGVKRSFNMKEAAKSEQSKWVFIHFWATWCAPCEAELPALLKFMQGTAKEQATFYLVAVNDEERKVRKHFKKFEKIMEGLNVKLFLDDKSEYYQKFGTAKVPETYVFDSKSLKLVRKFVGPQEWDQKRYREFLNSLSN